MDNGKTRIESMNNDSDVPTPESQIPNPDSRPLDSESRIPNPDIAISVQNLTKIYKLYDSPLHRLKETIIPFGKKYHKDFYALKDVSFEIKKGETVGIIGQNGSGKSTLLKIIAGVLSPSSGTVTVNGKVSALLELGAGFNPELTGLENVYFNGTLMGYPREEMDAKLDDILSFADIGDFVHQPVKMYSSGMFVRLAFAVQIMIDPDILIVDEALAVGDAPFQRKCFNIINELKEKGTTLMLVSHDLHAIERHCSKCVYLQNGTVKIRGNVLEVLNVYYDEIRSSEDSPFTLKSVEDLGSGEVILEDVVLFGEDGGKANLFRAKEKILIRLFYHSKQSIQKPTFGFSVWSLDPVTNESFRVFTINTMTDSFKISHIEGSGAVQCAIDALPLLPGKYHIRAGIYDKDGQMPYCLWGWSGIKASFIVSSREKGGFILKDSLGVIDLDGIWEIPKIPC